MAFVYILYSPSSDTFYTGSCLDIEQRIKQHKNKEISGAYTARQQDWELFHFIPNLDYEQARLIESHIKRMKSKTYIRNLTNYPEISCRLVNKYKG
jgi:putative endonuclease